MGVIRVRASRRAKAHTRHANGSSFLPPGVQPFKATFHQIRRSHQGKQLLRKASKRGSALATIKRANNAQLNFGKYYNKKYPLGHYSIPEKRRKSLAKRRDIIGRVSYFAQVSRNKKKR